MSTKKPHTEPELVDLNLKGTFVMTDLLDQLMDARQEDVITLVRIEATVSLPPRRKIPS